LIPQLHGGLDRGRPREGIETLEAATGPPAPASRPRLDEIGCPQPFSGFALCSYRPLAGLIGRRRLPHGDLLLPASILARRLRARPLLPLQVLRPLGTLRLAVRPVCLGLRPREVK